MPTVEDCNDWRDFSASAHRLNAPASTDAADMAKLTDGEEQLDGRPDARIDGPHAVRKSAAAKRKVLAAAAFADVDDRQGLDLLAMNPIEGQAADIADRLARQQADLDRRAALLDSQEADLESKLRAARMWIDEQRRELEDREAAIEAAGTARSAAEVSARKQAA